MKLPKIFFSARTLIKIIALAIFFFVFGFAMLFSQNSKTKEPKELEILNIKTETTEVIQKKEAEFISPVQVLIQKCPEAWYDNQMPQVVKEGSIAKITEYLIMNGKRVELKEVDMKWVSENCQIKKQTIF